MRSLSAAALVTIALSSAPAVAGPYDVLQAQAEGSDLAQPVELKLYTGAFGNGFTPRVMASFEAMEDGATEAPTLGLLMLGSGGRMSVMTSGMAERLGLAVKHKKVNGEKVEYVVVDDLWLGDERQVHLQGVTFAVDQTPEPQLEDADSFDEYVYLDLGATGLAWAVRPSTGTVHFAPADQGGALLAAVGGTTMPYRTTVAQKIQWGREKGWTPGIDLLVASTVGGATVDLALELAGASDLSSQVQLPADAVADKWGDRSFHWLATSLGGVSLGSTWFRAEPAYQALGPDLYAGGPVNLGTVGARALTRVDIAVDPANSQLALAPAAGQVRHDPRPVVLANAEKALQKCLEPAEPLPEDQASKPAGERCATQYADLAVIKGAMGDTQGVIDAWKTVTDAAPNDCSNWMELGSAHVGHGDATPALEAFGKSSELYHAWFAMDAWDREAAEEDFGKLSEEEQAAATLRPQSPNCSAADLGLASVSFALGKHDDVARIYKDFLDLDPALAAVYGAQLTLADEVEAAHGPWRMVDHLSLRRNSWAKAGLGRLFAQQGDWASADTNYRIAMEMVSTDSRYALMWAEDVFAALGEKDALHEARKLAAENPGALGPQAAVARIARLAGKDTGFLTSTADADFAEVAALGPNDAAVQATYARYLLDTGRADKAGQVIEAALKDDPNAAIVWVAKAELHTMAGEPARAKKAYARALKMSGGDPAFTLLADKAE